jgi:putative hydrolase of the HAD superfamily
VQREAWRRSLLACGIEDDRLTDLATQTFAAEESATHRLYEDARSLLELLAGRYPMAVITNGAGDTQRMKLRAVGIDGRFGAVAISAELGFAKPDPAIFAHALRALGVSAAEAWHIGDSLANDIGGANAAGVRSIWLNRTGITRGTESPEPDAEIRGLDEVVRLLDLAANPRD